MYITTRTQALRCFSSVPQGIVLTSNVSVLKILDRR
jgi:hypothetical protein